MLLLRLLMRSVFLAPLAILFEFYLPLHLFLVLAGGVIRVLAGRTAKTYEPFGEFTLCHKLVNWLIS